MIVVISSVDHAISKWISSAIPHNGFFDFLFSFLSLKGYSFFIWLVIVGAVLFIEEVRDKKHAFIGYFLLSFISTALIVSYPLKNLFKRVRPEMYSHLPSLACPTDFSFPSGHAATAFAAATFLSAYDPKRRLFYYFVAVMISLSRIYLQCHYLLDVIGGAIVGTAISYGVLWIRGKKIGNFYLPK